MQFQPNQVNIRSLISRRMQISFVLGLLLGILLGWLFSGVVGAVMRFGFVAVVMLIFLAAVFFWWNTRKASNEGEGTTVVTWTSSGLPQSQDEIFRQPPAARPEPRDQDVIDLQELKEQMERERRQ